MSKYLPVKYLMIAKKKQHSSLSRLKNEFFGAPFWGGFQWSCPTKFREKKLRLQLNNFTQKLDFDVLWFRRRAYKNQEEKKRKKKRNKPHCGQKWVGWDERVS